MKNKILFLAVISILGLASCTTQRLATQEQPLPVSTKDTVREGVSHFDGLLSMHPLLVTVQTKEATYFCYLATNADAICITTDASFDSVIAEYLPLKLDPEKLVVMQSSYIEPLSTFTPEEFEGMKEKFEKLGAKLNRYNVARIFNVATTTWSDYRKLVLNRDGQEVPVVTNTTVRNQSVETNNTSSTERKSTRRDQETGGRLKINYADKNNKTMTDH